MHTDSTHTDGAPGTDVSPPPPAPTDGVTEESMEASTLPAAPPAATLLPDEAADLPDDRYLNRELSWLDFNSRVLALAEDTSLPLLDRAKFLAIFASNLDEFFMVRVAGLKRRIDTGIAVPTNVGRAPSDLSLIHI